MPIRTTPAPPSREAEIAARLDAAERQIEGPLYDVLVEDGRYLLAQLQQARQERDEARGAEQLAMGHLRSLQEDHIGLRARVEAFESDIEEHEHLRERLIFLLTGTVNAIRGLPEPMHVHGWQSLPEEATAMKAALQQAREALDHYGQHRPDCPIVDEDGNFHPVLCTCGLDAALKAVR